MAFSSSKRWIPTNTDMGYTALLLTARARHVKILRVKFAVRSSLRNACLWKIAIVCTVCLVTQCVFSFATIESHFRVGSPDMGSYKIDSYQHV